MDVVGDKFHPFILVLSGLSVCLNLGETFAMIIFAVRYRAEIVRRDSNAAVMTPDWLQPDGWIGLRFSRFHACTSLVNWLLQSVTACLDGRCPELVQIRGSGFPP